MEHKQAGAGSILFFSDCSSHQAMQQQQVPQQDAGPRDRPENEVDGIGPQCVTSSGFHHSSTSDHWTASISPGSLHSDPGPCGNGLGSSTGGGGGRIPEAKQTALPPASSSPRPWLTIRRTRPG